MSIKMFSGALRSTCKFQSVSAQIQKVRRSSLSVRVQGPVTWQAKPLSALVVTIQLVVTTASRRIGRQTALEMIADVETVSFRLKMRGATFQIFPCYTRLESMPVLILRNILQTMLRKMMSLKRIAPKVNLRTDQRTRKRTTLEDLRLPLSEMRLLLLSVAQNLHSSKGTSHRIQLQNLTVSRSSNIVESATALFAQTKPPSSDMGSATSVPVAVSEVAYHNLKQHESSISVHQSSQRQDESELELEWPEKVGAVAATQIADSESTLEASAHEHVNRLGQEHSAKETEALSGPASGKSALKKKSTKPRAKAIEEKLSGVISTFEPTVPIQEFRDEEFAPSDAPKNPEMGSKAEAETEAKLNTIDYSVDAIGDLSKKGVE
jgi:hypothetical protein